MLWRFFTRWNKGKAIFDGYYMMGFLVLLASGLLLIFGVAGPVIFLGPFFAKQTPNRYSSALNS